VVHWSRIVICSSTQSETPTPRIYPNVFRTLSTGLVMVGCRRLFNWKSRSSTFQDAYSCLFPLNMEGGVPFIPFWVAGVGVVCVGPLRPLGPGLDDPGNWVIAICVLAMCSSRPSSRLRRLIALSMGESITHVLGSEMISCSNVRGSMGGLPCEDVSSGSSPLICSSSSMSFRFLAVLYPSLQWCSSYHSLLKNSHALSFPLLVVKKYLGGFHSSLYLRNLIHPFTSVLRSLYDLVVTAMYSLSSCGHTNISDPSLFLSNFDKTPCSGTGSKTSVLGLEMGSLFLNRSSV
jgi:hypothetical protein